MAGVELRRVKRVGSMMVREVVRDLEGTAVVVEVLALLSTVVGTVAVPAAGLLVLVLSIVEGVDVRRL